MRFCFSLAETLGVIDPRVLFEQMDSELLALWLAHYALKHPDQTHTAQHMADHSDVDAQVSACEKILL